MEELQHTTLTSKMSDVVQRTALANSKELQHTTVTGKMLNVEQRTAPE